MLIFICAFGAKAQNHTDFIPITLPSPHIMENSVAFGQDAQGQTWLVTEQGLSVFRDIQFVSFRSFSFEQKITGAEFIGNDAFITTPRQVFRVSLTNPHSTLTQVWPTTGVKEKSQIEVVKILQGKGNLVDKTNLYLQTTAGIYQLSLIGSEPQQSVISNLIRPIEQLQQPKQVTSFNEHIFLLFDDTIEQYSSLDNSWQTFGFDNEFVSFAAVKNSLVMLNQQGDLYSLNLDTAKIDKVANQTGISELISSGRDLHVRKGEFLYSTRNPALKVREANFSQNVFIDRSGNIWLSTPFDIQVSWWQPISVEPQDAPVWSDFANSNLITKSKIYALKNGTLYERQVNGRQSWLPVWQPSPNENKVYTHLFETQNHLWLVSANRFIALDKNSMTVTTDKPRQSGDAVFPFDTTRLIYFAKDEIRTLSGDGREIVLQDPIKCNSDCALPWKVSNSVHLGDALYFATSQGLHRVDKKDLSRSIVRLDALNQLTPLLSLAVASNQKLWLIYPNKVALFDPSTLQSKIYYSGFNRIFDATSDIRQDLVFNSQRGWFKLSSLAVNEMNAEPNFVVQQVIDDYEAQYLVNVGNKIALSSDSDEIRLAFNIAKQHPSQQMQVRFKYSDEINWTVVSMFNHSLTLKNLRQGANQLELQARLEGQSWQHAKSFNYILPYRFFQTKWVIIFVAGFLLVLLMVIVYERIGRVKVAFNSVTQEAFILSLLDSTRDGVWIANKDREIQSVNQAFVDITGYQLEDVDGKSFQLHADFGRNHELESLIWQEVTKTGFWVGEVWSKKSSGEKVSLDLSVTRVETENRLMSKTDVKFVGVFSDITHRKNSEQELRLLATRDPLTNLPNRTLFTEHVQHTIDMTTAHAPNFAVMFLDLDNFKKVNESFGPLKGDEFIGLVAERIAKCLVKGITLARLGGDEFAILIPNQMFSGVPAFFIKRIAKDIQRELRPAFWLDETEISISVSMGASVYPIHGDKPEVLMRCADTALNRVKITGRNNCLIYDDVMDDLVNDKLSLESELIAGLNRNEFLVYYQPKFKLKENEVCGFEALVRWQNPNRGLVSPDQFISIAEDNGLIRQLDFYVLKTVCQQVKVWLKSGLMRGKVAVNISALNFQQADFCDSLLKIIESEGNLHNYIELEITETAMMREPERALKSVGQLRSKGLSIALDDFGTGHSSLGYLKTFPIDRIKIDRTFVKDIEFDEQDRNITSVIVQLAKHLGIAVIAEGIETEAQAYLMHVMGCNEIQGYLISRPVAADQVPELLKSEYKQIGSIDG
ncbi:EAL domain-containing protein [Psychrosphaera sp. 1_MG-2023]|uniref:putative bifunctional diguanylate cyclase/phosphodiesterase n=1 Tax=Psychrosphaera sp. 1_MG-2023 TaxID=3062643 RepID=UPI0026E29135|nr:EAL domain-containing protein [Psychrosphaera sp. 1_MG-2023]MDO6720688.1 EAL domain-containing protein [Psychrosphaera sp. 1_MG-2023]